MPLTLLVDDDDQHISQGCLLMPVTCNTRGSSVVIDSTSEVLDGLDTSGRSATVSPEDSSAPGTHLSIS